MASLFLVATPIGHIQDISVRALSILRSVPALVCEDTRVTLKILSYYKIPRPLYLLSVNTYNEHKNVSKVIQLLSSGYNVAYTSDAGTPGISDPGYLLARDSHRAGHAVTVLPGPSAVLTALVASRLPITTFTFLGFLPRQLGQRRILLSRFVFSPDTLVFYESPRRLGQSLVNALEILGNRYAAIAINLTRRFESVTNNRLSELVKLCASSIRGEVTVIIAGHSSKPVK